jgi:hypothetical protein
LSIATINEQPMPRLVTSGLRFLRHKSHLPRLSVYRAELPAQIAAYCRLDGVVRCGGIGFGVCVRSGSGRFLGERRPWARYVCRRGIRRC